MQLSERVRSELAAETRFRNIELLEVTDSTNRVLGEAAAAGAPEGSVVVADRQTAGRGRADRIWESRSGEGLLVSVLFRPTLDRPRWHLVTAAAALAARAACESVASVRPSIKWPNDLIVGDAKLAGILAEATGTSVVVGMGLNVKGGPPGCAVLEREADRSVDRAELLVAWLRSLEEFVRDWDAVAHEYRLGCATVGRVVDVTTPTGGYLGVAAVGVDEAGRLLVETSDGPVALSVGDVTHVRPATGTW